MRNFFTVISLAALTSAVQASEHCEYESQFERVFKVPELADLAIKVGAGSLTVRGKSEVDHIVVKARACASNEATIEELDVEFDADSATMSTNIPDSKGWNEYASIDLEITLPSRLNLDVRDSSGRAVVDNIASLVMKDSSGELQISKVAGPVVVTDSSGALDIKGVEGDVQVTDSSGAIEASDIKGDFTILADSSGGIDIRRVAKNVEIKVDGSGSINVRNVGGDFIVGKDGSGGIRYDNVEGKVSLPTK